MKYLLILLIAFSLQLNAQSIVKAVHDVDTYKIETTEYLIGEDTIYTKVVTTDWCRIVGVDGPEIIWPGHITESQPFGRAFGDSIRLLIKGKTVGVEFFEKDVYKRPLVRVTINGKDLAEIILAKGWGIYVRNDLDKGTRRHYQYLRDKAKKAKLGIWSREDQMSPSDWRKTHKPVN